MTAPSAQVLVGDCREVMTGMEPESVDMILTDPPYGDTSLEWDVRATGWLPEVRRLLKPTGSMWCFGSLRFLMGHASEFSREGWRLAQDVVWEKHNGSSFHADRFKRVHELTAQFYRDDAFWADIYKSPIYTQDATARVVRRRGETPHAGKIGSACSYQTVDGGPRLQRSVIKVRSCNGYAEHPTQKPVSLLIPLIEYSCPPGGIVLDPFAGSGSTGRAAKDCGRSAVLIEIDPEYCEVARRRLWQEVLPLGEDAS